MCQPASQAALPNPTLHRPLQFHPFAGMMPPRPRPPLPLQYPHLQLTITVRIESIFYCITKLRPPLICLVCVDYSSYVDFYRQTYSASEILNSLLINLSSRCVRWQLTIIVNSIRFLILLLVARKGKEFYRCCVSCFDANRRTINTTIPYPVL